MLFVQALDDNMSMQWESPYMKYLLKIRTELSLISLLKDTKLNSVLNAFFINKINCDLNTLCLSGVLPMKSLLRQRYSSECAQSECIARFRYNIVNIGHRIPRPGTDTRKKFCPNSKYSYTRCFLLSSIRAYKEASYWYILL